MKFATKVVHAGQEPDPATGAVNVPVYLTSTYSQREQSAYVYGRTGNPTRAALEKAVAALEEGTRGLAFSSGMGAITTAMTLLKKGDHVVVTDDCYGGVHRLFTRIMSGYGVEASFVDCTDLVEVEDAMRPETQMVWIESPTNPLMKVIDIKECGVIAKAHESPLVVDNTFASPALQRPLKLGADVVVHSTTKYLGGHADLLGGALVVSDDGLYDKLKFAQNALGAVPSPFDCYLTLRGIKTLDVRMNRHCDNAEAIAAWLSEQPNVDRVMYPGLESDPGHAMAKKQMSRFGGMLSFVVKDPADVKERLKRLKVVVLAESLGGVESLIEHPASMTHAGVPKEERDARGVSDGLIRLSVGIEDEQDLMEDMNRLLG